MSRRHLEGRIPSLQKPRTWVPARCGDPSRPTLRRRLEKHQFLERRHQRKKDLHLHPRPISQHKRNGQRHHGQIRQCRLGKRSTMTDRPQEIPLIPPLPISRGQHRNSNRGPRYPGRQASAHLSSRHTHHRVSIERGQLQSHLK